MGVGVGYSAKFHSVRLLPEVQPLNLLYPFFSDRKDTPFVSFLFTNSTHFTCLQLTLS